MNTPPNLPSRPKALIVLGLVHVVLVALVFAARVPEWQTELRWLPPSAFGVGCGLLGWAWLLLMRRAVRPGARAPLWAALALGTVITGGVVSRFSWPHALAWAVFSVVSVLGLFLSTRQNSRPAA